MQRKCLTGPALRRATDHVLVTGDQVTRHRLGKRLIRGLALFDGLVALTRDWLEVPLGDGWVAAYRLAHDRRGAARRTRILELRVFPDGLRSTPGEWAGSGFQRPPQELPDGGFRFERLHRGVTEKSFNAALAATRANADRQHALDAFGAPGSRLTGPSNEGRGAGRPGRPRSHYARIALRYHELEHDTRREAGRSTRSILAQENGVPLTTVAKWLTTARKQGFLTPVKRGERGSMATDIARQFANRSAAVPKSTTRKES